MLNIGRPDPPIVTRPHRGRASARHAFRHPTYRPDRVPEKVPDWVGTDDDPQWVRVRDELRSSRHMKDLQAAIQDCQVGVAHLASFSEGHGPVGQAARRALQSLALDLHGEYRRSVSFDVGQVRPSAFLRPGSIAHWVLSPVGSGDNSLVADHRSVSRSHRAAVFTRLSGVALACVGLLLDLPVAAMVVLIASVMSSGWRRYRDNVEPAVTFRARYLSCLLGHLGDVLVLTTAMVWLVQRGALWWPAPVAVTLMLFATTVRTGALQVGVYVPRYRVDRVIRVGSIAVGVLAVALWTRFGFLVTLVGIGGFSAMEIYRILRDVWSAGVTEFAWVTSTTEGYVSSLSGGPPPESEETT